MSIINIRIDLTTWTDAQRDALLLELVVQCEASDAHPSATPQITDRSGAGAWVVLDDISGQRATVIASGCTAAQAEEIYARLPHDRDMLHTTTHYAVGTRIWYYR